MPQDQGSPDVYEGCVYLPAERGGFGVVDDAARARWPENTNTLPRLPGNGRDVPVVLQGRQTVVHRGLESSHTSAGNAHSNLCLIRP